MRCIRLIAILTFFIFSCGEAEDESTEFKHPDDIFNPNGDSELSLVMRNMHHEAYLLREQLKENESPDLSKFMEVSSKIMTAEATDPSVRDSTFMIMSERYLKEIPEIKGENRFIEYEDMVQRCLDCHNYTCPGPKVKIRKLLDFRVSE